jgi:hypothetical protein
LADQVGIGHRASGDPSASTPHRSHSAMTEADMRIATNKSDARENRRRRLQRFSIRQTAGDQRPVMATHPVCRRMAMARHDTATAAASSR